MQHFYLLQEQCSKYKTTVTITSKHLEKCINIFQTSGLLTQRNENFTDL